MKLTKYGHACLVLEEQGKKLVIDPGEFTDDFNATDNVVAVVITHIHGDHLSREHLQKIIAKNSDVKIFTTKEVAKEWDSPHTQIARHEQQLTIGPFDLRFYGESHTAVHPEWPQNQNIGVLVNDNLYYPGDSFTIPNRKVAVLALPAGAPWLKTGDALDCLKTINPRLFFRTHDGLWNDRGLIIVDRWFNMASEKFGPKYHALNPGESIEI